MWMMCAVALEVSLAGCGKRDVETASFSPGDRPRKQVALENEWRMGWRVPAQGAHVARLEIAPAFRATLRLGVLPVGEATGPVQIPVLLGKDFVGARAITSIAVEHASQWQDVRLDLGLSDSPRTLFVDFGKATGMWVSHCEIAGEIPQPPNVLVVLVDTLRKDHLGAYGYPRDTSPHIDALAKDAIVFRDLVPHSSWTRPSVASLFTSVYPEVHGAQDRPDVIRDGLPTLAGAFSKAHYQTMGFVTNIHLLPLWGFDRGFSRYVDVDAANWREADDGKAVDRAIDALRDAAGRPWFMYLHLMGPHDPYTPPPPFDTKFAAESGYIDPEPASRQHDIDLYDGEIAYTDSHIGRLWQALHDSGQYDNTLIVLLSDHGEEFWEHGGQYHTRTLYEEMLGVPLIVKLPGNRRAGELRRSAVEMIDVAPTLLDLAGMAPEPGFHGVSFANIIEDPSAPGRTGYASLTYDALSLRSAKQSGQKYIRDVVAGTELWFDLAADPGEQTPLGADPPLAMALSRRVDAVAARGASGLHILITCGDGADHTIEGTVSAPGLGVHEFRYYEWKSESRRDGDTVRFSMHTRDPRDVATHREEWHTKYAEQDNAHLVVPAPPDGPVSIRIEVDGMPLQSGIGTAGNIDSPSALDGTPLRPIDILASPNAFDPAALPRKFAVYVFYVAEPGSISLDDLDPDVVDAMEGLGYLK